MSTVTTRAAIMDGAVHITGPEIGVMCQCLGWKAEAASNRWKTPHRNHYVHIDGGELHNLWQGLEGRGLARKRPSPPVGAGVHEWQVTPLGRASLRVRLLIDRDLAGPLESGVSNPRTDPGPCDPLFRGYL